MPEETVRWDALTYDGSAPARQVPTLHLFLKPIERSGDAPAIAQRLFQDVLSRFYSCSPFLPPKEKLAETIRFALDEAAAAFGHEALSQVQIGVAILDPAEGRVHLYRRGDVRVYRSDREGEVLLGEGEETLPIDPGQGIALLDGPAAEEYASMLDQNEDAGPAASRGRMILEGGTAGIWISFGEAPSGGAVEEPRPVLERAADLTGAALPERERAAQPIAPSVASETPSRFSTLPFAVLLLIFLVALFWKGEEEEKEEPTVTRPSPPAQATIQEEAAPAPTFPAGTLLWDYRADAAVTSSPRVVADRVFVGSRDGYLHALDVHTGTEVWAAAGPGGVGSSPAVAEGKVFFGEYGGDLVAVDLGTGEEVWRHGTEGRIVSSPIFHDGAVFVGSYDRHVYSVSAETGERIWRRRTGGVVWSSPAVAGGLVYAGSWDGKVYALDISTGEEVWSHGTDERIYASPTVHDGYVYIGSFDGTFSRLDGRSGEPVWSVRLGGAIQSTAAAAEDIIIVGCEDGSVYSLYGETGEILWSYPTGGRVPSSPVVRNGIAYIGSYDRFLYALDMDQGYPVWRVDVGASIYSSPSLGDNALFVGTNQGRLIALSLGG